MGVSKSKICNTCSPHPAMSFMLPCACRSRPTLVSSSSSFHFLLLRGAARLFCSLFLDVRLAWVTRESGTRHPDCGDLCSRAFFMVSPFSSFHRRRILRVPQGALAVMIDFDLFSTSRNCSLSTETGLTQRSDRRPRPLQARQSPSAEPL